MTTKTAELRVDAHEGADTWKAKPIDRCIAPIIEGLQRGGVRTLGSCCGHGQRPGEIVLEDGRSLVVVPTGEVAEIEEDETQ